MRRVRGEIQAKYAAWCCGQQIDDISKCSMQFIREDAVKAAFVTTMNKLSFGWKAVYDVNGELGKTEEVKKLIKYAGTAETPTEFDGGLFEEYVENIYVLSRTEIGFHMKYGLLLREGV